MNTQKHMKGFRTKLSEINKVLMTFAICSRPTCHKKIDNLFETNPEFINYIYTDYENYYLVEEADSQTQNVMIKLLAIMEYIEDKDCCETLNRVLCIIKCSFKEIYNYFYMYPEEILIEPDNIKLSFSKLEGSKIKYIVSNANVPDYIRYLVETDRFGTDYIPFIAIDYEKFMGYLLSKIKDKTEVFLVSYVAVFIVYTTCNSRDTVDLFSTMAILGYNPVEPQLTRTFKADNIANTLKRLEIFDKDTYKLVTDTKNRKNSEFEATIKDEYVFKEVVHHCSYIENYLLENGIRLHTNYQSFNPNIDTRSLREMGMKWSITSKRECHILNAIYGYSMKLMFDGLIKDYKNLKDFYMKHKIGEIKNIHSNASEDIAEQIEDNKYEDEVSSLNLRVKELEEALRLKDAENKKLEEKIEDLENEIKENNKELVPLREFIFESSNDVNSNKEHSEDLIDNLSAVKGIVIGGNKIWRDKVSKALDSWTVMDGDTPFMYSILRNYDVVILNTLSMGHSVYNGVISEVRKSDIKLGYSNTTNMDITFETFYKLCS